MKLFRPVGYHEAQLIAEADYRAFPPRLPGQPIFYPVLTRDYAIRIARDWNTKDAASGLAGYVTEFEIDDEFAARYDVQTAGSSREQELWVPAEELEEFNRHIIGRIRIVERFFGDGFVGERDAW